MTTQEIHDYLRSTDKGELRFFPFQVAKDTSDLAAVLLYDLQRRIAKQKKPLNREHLQWTYDPMRVFVETHPYSSEPGVRKGFLALEKAGMIQIQKKGKFNRKGYDKKWWYHVTQAGMKVSRLRLIRFAPGVAEAIKIPKAVLLHKFRFESQKKDAGEYIILDPSQLGIPYSVKTIQRHLDDLVDRGVLERNSEDDNQYRIAGEPAVEVDWREQKEPITVQPAKLLPRLKPGEIGLLVGHSGTGKTSVASFAAVQMALAGLNVIYAALEEPLGDIVNRMYAQECGVSYTDLHKNLNAAQTTVQVGVKSPNDRLLCLRKNLKFVDLSGRFSQTHEVVNAIAQLQVAGFHPHVVFVDQLEWITVEQDASDDGIEAGQALAPALALRDSFGDVGFSIWVLHQVLGQCTDPFPVSDIIGGDEVAGNFDRVVGIGRAVKDAKELRMFSMDKKTKFEQILDADFSHMRFRPKK